MPKLGLLQIFVFIGFMEVFGIMNSRRPDYKPGDFLGSTQWETGASWDDFQVRIRRPPRTLFPIPPSPLPSCFSPSLHPSS